MAFIMTPQGVGPYDYTVGVVFEAVLTGTQIRDGAHNFYFEASDGVVMVPTRFPIGTGTIEGPTVNDPPNAVSSGFDPATLTPGPPPVAPWTQVGERQPIVKWSPTTDPNLTDTPGTLLYRLEFSLYNDTWGAPEFATYTVEGITPAQLAAGVQPAAPLLDGIWYWSVFAIDNDPNDPLETQSAVQAFQLRQRKCQLALPPLNGTSAFSGADYVDGLHPETGEEGDEFTFVVKYSDPDNDPPETIQVVVNNTEPGQT